MLVGTLYDIIAIQRNQPKEQEKMIKFKPPSLMHNGVNNSGYSVESEESNISNGVVTDMSIGDMKTHEAMELTVKGTPKEEPDERIVQPMPMPARRGKKNTFSRTPDRDFYCYPCEIESHLPVPAREKDNKKTNSCTLAECWPYSRSVTSL